MAYRIAGWMGGFALAAAVVTQAAQADTARFYGYAYDLSTNKYLYTEVHEQKLQGERWIGGKIAYYAPDGSLLGRKTLDFSADPFVPVYQMEMAKSGFVEAITASGDPIQLKRRQKTGAEYETKSVKREGEIAADSGFHPFLVAHFAELMEGKTVKFRFAAAGNLDTFKFRAQRIADTTFEGKPAVRFRAEPDSFLRLLAGPLELSYDAKTKKLCEYRGISNIHDPATGAAYPSVRIAYYSTPPADTPKLPPLQ